MAIFRPQSDMKPKLFQRGCTLKEISTFLTSFENYMSHGYQNKFPQGAVHSQILVCVDETWLTALEDKGLGKDEQD